MLYRAPDNSSILMKAVIFSLAVHVAAGLAVSFKRSGVFQDRLSGPIQMIDLMPSPPGKGGGRAGVSRPAPPPPPVRAEVKKPSPPEPKPVAKPVAKALPRPAPKTPPQAVVIGKKPPEPKPVAKPEPKPEPKPEYSATDFEEKMRRLRDRVPDKEASTAKPRRTEADVRRSIENLKSRVGDAEEKVQPRVPGRAEDVSSTGPGVVGGSSTGAGTVADMRFAAYRARLWSHVKDFWNIPPSLTGRGLYVVLVAEVSRNGVIMKYWIEESSGVDTFDQSALRALLNASPLPAVPADIPDRAFEDGLGFRFSE